MSLSLYNLETNLVIGLIDIEVSRAMFELVMAFCANTVTMVIILNQIRTFPQGHQQQSEWVDRDNYVELSKDDSRALGGIEQYKYSRDMPIVYIEGVPRSEK